MEFPKSAVKGKNRPLFLLYIGVMSLPVIELLLYLVRWETLFFRLFHGRMPDTEFFEWEIFLAEGGVPKLYGVVLWLLLIPLATLIYQFRRNGSPWWKWIVAIVPVLILSLPPWFGVCGIGERIRRMVCVSELKQLGTRLRLYQEAHGVYPPDLEGRAFDGPFLPEGGRCGYVYYGAGRTEPIPPFVLSEDRFHNHAGDYRNRLWSDGRVDGWYPWKTPVRKTPGPVPAVARAAGSGEK